MNFLLHVHLALRDTGSAAASWGAALPDLWRMAHRRAHARRLPDHVEAPALRAGLAHHAEADHRFHDSPALRRGEEALRGATEGLRAPRLGLFAHPLWELCLDGALARARGPRALRQGLAAALAAAGAEREAGERALGAALGDDGPVFLARMARIEGELIEGPWIDAYTHGDGLAFCLDAMRSRTGLPRLDPDERRLLGQRLEALAPLADELLALALA